MSARHPQWTTDRHGLWASVVHHLFDPDPAQADSIGEHKGRAKRGGGEVLICDGCLVLHRDGEIAYCSEELDGKTCAGYDMPHLAGVMACRITPRGTRCRHCDEVMRIRLMVAPDFVPDGVRTVTN
jgi:hypothetical protein